MEPLLTEADKLERDYNWLEAANSYMSILDTKSEHDKFRNGLVCERLGYALFRAARQAEAPAEFRERMQQANESYQRAETPFQETPSGEGWTLRCRAMRANIDYWLASDSAEKKRCLEESWRLTKVALKTFREGGNSLEYARTHNQLVASAVLLTTYVSDFQTYKNLLMEGLDYAEESLKSSSTLSNDESSRAYVIAAGWLRGISSDVIPDPDERDDYSKKSDVYWTKGLELSEEAAFLQLTSHLFALWLVLGHGTEEALKHSADALNWAMKSRDRLNEASALEMLAHNSFWKEEGVEDAEERSRLLKKALEYAEGAQKLYSAIEFLSEGTGVLWSAEPHTEYYWRSSSLETDLKKRKELLEKALSSGPNLLKLAEESGHPSAISSAHHVLSKSLVSLAKIEKKTDLKRNLLDRALEHRNRNIEIYRQLCPYTYWDIAVHQNYQANIKSEMAQLADYPTNKILLQEAVKAKETSLKILEKLIPLIEKAGYQSNLAWIGYRSYEFGDLLTSLYEGNRDIEALRKAAEILELAVETFQKANLLTPIAECYWKLAQTYELLGEHLQSAEKFSQASESYRAAAEKLTQLKEFYQDYSTYMEAWSEIEKASHYHSKQAYGLAEKHYRKAAELHEATKHWKSFSFNYSALSQLEAGENLSREDRGEEAIKVFTGAARLFAESKRSIQSSIGLIEGTDESKMASLLIQAADGRKEYSEARVLIEEARVLGRKGDHDSSASKYGEASMILERLCKNATSDQDRREITLILSLSKAWQTMARAESKSSSKLYGEAGQLFDEARELGQNELERLLIQGHSHFCRALAAETSFTDSSDESLRETAIQHLQTASDLYLRAGFRSDSEYTKATRLLLDAYVYVHGANKEIAPEKKAKLYLLAERVLEASANSYEKAGQPARREQVTALLSQVKEEKVLVASLIEVMQAPSIVSATSSFSTPTPNFEKPVGLERFDQANIQTHLIAGRKNLKVGENLDFEIELVNAGKEPAQLVKMQDVIPEGFELVQRPDAYRLEENALNMRGKLLESLRTEGVRLVLKSKVQGNFFLKPRILYLDESGNYKSHEAEPIEITVKELGVSGWLRGSG